MGSRAVVIVCRDEDGGDGNGSASPRASSASSSPAPAGGSSTIPTWSGSSSTGCVRPSTAADLWAKLETSWACLDCELMPWSAKAQELLRTQYAAVGSAGSAALPRAVAALEQAAESPGRAPSGTSSPQIEARLPAAGAGHRPVRRRLPALLLAGRAR